MHNPQEPLAPVVEPGASRWQRVRDRRPRWVDGLRFRIAVPFVALAVLVFAILYVALSQSIEQEYIDRLAEETASQARISAYAIAEARNDGQDDAQIVGLIDHFAELSDARFTLIAPDGEVLADTFADVSTMENHGDRPEVLAAIEEGTGEYRRTSDTIGESFLYVAVPIPDSEGSVLRVAVPVSQIDGVVGEMGQSLLAAVIFSLLLTLLASWFIAVWLSRPLEALRDQASAVGAGDYAARVEPSEVVELAAVGQTFNSMAERLQEVIQQRERTSLRLEAIMAGLVDGIVLTDGHGNVLRMNNAAEDMLEIAEDDAYGRPFVQVTRDHELWMVLRSALTGKKKPSATVEHGIERASLLITARVVTDDDDERMGLVVLRDVTDLRRLETIRREFVANVSHELRTPLTSIRALVETLESGAIEEEEIAMDFLGRIVGEVDRLNALVEDLLDFARLEAGRAPLRLERVNIGEAVRVGAERLWPQIERARLELAFDLAEDLPDIDVDVARIEQVIVNLLHNAIKFTPAGGTLTVRAYQSKRKVVVEVEDTGVGIPLEEQSRLFERFYKSDKARRSEGTGLGLAIAKNIVMSHGGEISVESTPGEGATFRFTLPLGRKKARKRARRHALGITSG